MNIRLPIYAADGEHREFLPVFTSERRAREYFADERRRRELHEITTADELATLLSAVANQGCEVVWIDPTPARPSVTVRVMELLERMRERSLLLAE